MALLIDAMSSEFSASGEPSYLDAVRAVLVAGPSPELRRVHVDATAEYLILTGSVSSFYMKQLAQETVRCKCAGRKMLNCIGVRVTSTVTVTVEA